MVDICENIENTSIIRRGYKPYMYKSLSAYGKVQFRHLLLKQFSNTFPSIDQQHLPEDAKLANMSYNMNLTESRRRGRCLILNYNDMTSVVSNFSSHTIGENDVQELKSVFGDLLNFEVEVFDNLTATATRLILEEGNARGNNTIYLAKSKHIFTECTNDHCSMDCFVLFLIAECYDRVLNSMDRNGTIDLFCFILSC